MARVLHIQASPMQQLSFSRRVAEAFLERYRRDHPGDEVRTVDLAKERLPAFDFPMASAKYKILHGRPPSKEEARVWKAVEEMIARFKEADKLVVSSPMWNFGIPYALKQYLDVIVQPTYTFSYSPEEGYKGLVTGRPALLILARGGSYGPGAGAGAGGRGGRSSRSGQQTRLFGRTRQGGDGGHPAVHGIHGH